MSRSRRRAAAPEKEQLPVTVAPAATIQDASVVVQLADAGVRAIVAAAAEYGLDGEPWDPDILHAQVMPIVAMALRRSTEWWARRPELANREAPDAPGE
jgi:hypothetical protein